MSDNHELSFFWVFVSREVRMVKFHLKATMLAQFYIERQLITSVSGGNSAEAQGEISLTSERPFFFSMQTQACSSGHKPAEIFWRLIDSDTPSKKERRL
jgi:hypothetical protein